MNFRSEDALRALVTYRITIPRTGRMLSLPVSGWGPRFTTAEREAAEFESYARGQQVLSRIRQTASPILREVLDDAQVDPVVHPHAEGVQTWEACVRLKNTALQCISLFVEGPPSYLREDTRPALAEVKGGAA